MYSYTKMNESLKTLGCNRSNSFEEIKKSYRKLANMTHPDKNSEPNAREMFIRVQESFEYVKEYQNKIVDNSDIKSGIFNNDEYHQTVNESSNAYAAAVNLLLDTFIPYRVFRKSRNENAFERYMSHYRTVFQKPMQTKIIYLSMYEAQNPNTIKINFELGEIKSRINEAEFKHIGEITHKSTAFINLRKNSKPIFAADIICLKFYYQDGESKYVEEGKPTRMVYEIKVERKLLKNGGSKLVTLPHTKKTLTVAIPEGSKDGSKLRLKGEGFLNFDGIRGDVYLTIKKKMF